ncbi:MAG: acyl-CoA dehydrogenase [Porticoccaceae bacterium]|nr:acyl-CoA dehydrogenase [Porticoccaceae bacterium]
MTDYRVPVQDQLFILKHIADLDQLKVLPGYEEISDELIEAILNEAATFFQSEVAPTNAIADKQGCHVDSNKVEVAPVLQGLYRQYCDGGWPSLTGRPQFGGQGLPHTLGFVIDEMLQSANLAFSLLPLLTQGVITALGRYGSDSQKAFYLPRLISGEWTGTMNLTEPQAGTDLGLVKTRAEPEGNHYRLVGQKIFITWGDHSLADNIIHLVLARTPGAPEGVKGISLFIVPKFVSSADGTLAERNDAYPIGVEEKMGIHASPTCTMSFGENGGAVGYLVGEENQGLKYMFAMMNHARLAVGLQGVSVSERAFQHALGYARQRLQGSRPGRSEAAAIIEHPDVRRMLLVMQALTWGGRAMTLSAMTHFDLAAHHPDKKTREFHQQRIDLLTPLVKAWCTEIGNEVTSLGIQIHGGMGYVEETGVAQYYRDARIAAIYEGTNGIQGLDLVGRKLLLNGGAFARSLFEELDDVIELCREQQLESLADKLAQALTLCREAVATLLTTAPDRPDLAGAVAFNLLMLLGTTVAGCYLGKGAAKATGMESFNSGNTEINRKAIDTALVFAEQVLPRCQAYAGMVRAGENTLMSAQL